LESETTVVLDFQRVKFAQEFDDGIKFVNPGGKTYGVLFSGPTGVGKSAIGLLSFLNQFAQSRPVVYFPFGKDWVLSSRNPGSDIPSIALVCDNFIKRFFIQNADLIEAHPVFADIFRSFFNGKPADVDTYNALVDALEAENVPQCSFIVDESQALTESASSITEKGKSPFSQDFNQWTGQSKRFVSQLLASNHGLREFNLPSGEIDRLRFVQPFDPSESAALLKCIDSPFHVLNSKDHKNIMTNTGGMPRAMYSFAVGLKAGSSVTFMSDREKFAMVQNCLTLWWNKFSEKEKQESFPGLLAMVRGEEQFNALAKPMYDQGLMKLVVRFEGLFVKPVNRIAENVLYDIYASQFSSRGVFLSSEVDEGARGIIFQRQVLAGIRGNSNAKISAVSFFGTANEECYPVSNFINLHSDEVAFVQDAYVQNGADILLNDAFVAGFDSNFERHPTRSVLYVPLNRLCMFDAILVPSQALSLEPISFIECSITDARCSGRLPKAANIATLVQSSLKKETGVRIVVFFSGELSELTKSHQSTKDKYSSTLLESAVIVCKEGCLQLGVRY